MGKRRKRRRRNNAIGYHISNPIECCKKENKRLNNDIYISLFVRGRIRHAYRNSHHEEWIRLTGLMEEMLSFKPYNRYNYKILQMGLKEENVDIGYEFIDDFYEQIYYLNNSLFLISALSGYGQFASCCNCDVIYFIENHSKKKEKSIRAQIQQVYNSNPFNKNVMVGMNIEEILKHAKNRLDEKINEKY